MGRQRNREQEVIVVGTGPSGATAALELSRRGKRVLMIELGKDHPVGRGALYTFRHLYDKHLVFSRSREGVIVDRALTLGGSSAVFAGNAFRPSKAFQDTLGIDLEPTVDETIAELKLAPFPDDFMSGWSGTQRLVEASDQLGASLAPQMKFIDPTRCHPKCDSCMFGCAINARWTARDYVRKAMAWPNGADLITETRVEKVLIDQGRAIGVQVRGRDIPSRLFADTVVLAAGGMGTPIILKRSGIEEAGRSFFMDPMDVLVGYTREKGPHRGMTFTHACVDRVESDGFMIGNTLGKGAYLSQMLRGRSLIRSLSKFFKRKAYTLGMFTKIADENIGSIDARGRMSKPMTAEDRQKMQKGDDLCRRILVKAGCDPATISTSTLVGGHPGGTAAMGVVVDDNFETRKIKNLFVCDTSVFPRSPGAPPVLTLISMVKRWAREVDVDAR
jgi:choline dehydrogenase-like flavoprotein